MVYSASNGPQNDTGNYSGPCSSDMQRFGSLPPLIGDDVRRGSGDSAATYHLAHNRSYNPAYLWSYTI